MKCLQPKTLSLLQRTLVEYYIVVKQSKACYRPRPRCPFEEKSASVLMAACSCLCVWWRSHDRRGWTLWGFQSLTSIAVDGRSVQLLWRHHSPVGSSRAATLPSAHSYSQHPTDHMFFTHLAGGDAPWLQPLKTAVCRQPVPVVTLQGDSYRLQSLQRLNKSPRSG